jgi:hypothetical protein
MFPVYDEKCLSCKEVHNWFEKFSQGCLKVSDNEGEVQNSLRQQSRLLCCRFRCTGKTMGQVDQCWWRICWEINVFSRFRYHIFYVLYPFVTCILTPSRIIGQLVADMPKSHPYISPSYKCSIEYCARKVMWSWLDTSTDTIFYNPEMSE